jgi:hypothetical protein
MPIRNLHANPALGANTTTWSADTGTTARTTPAGFDRPNAFQNTATGAGDLVIRSGNHPGFAPATTYVMYAQVRCSVAVNLGITLDWITSADGYISSSDGTYTTCVANTVETRSGVVTSPALTAKANLTVIAGPCAVGDTLEVTCALIEAAGSVTGYADGETASWVWDGTQYNSSSSLVATAPLRLPIQTIRVP